jgi:hypothetical protein
VVQLESRCLFLMMAWKSGGHPQAALDAYGFSAKFLTKEYDMLSIADQ